MNFRIGYYKLLCILHAVIFPKFLILKPEPRGSADEVRSLEIIVKIDKV